MKKTALFISCIIMPWFSTVPDLAWTGKVIDVRDGDFLKVSYPEKGVLGIMLYGIDARTKGSLFLSRQKSFCKIRWKGRS